LAGPKRRSKRQSKRFRERKVYSMRVKVAKVGLTYIALAVALGGDRSLVARAIRGFARRRAVGKRLEP
jgi:hypothetical protein